ncbi:hypothetical protein [Flavobacterium sp. 7A]|uniref:hypothetical protein n=1 Tax=Flavobacterium sp. 7A TaxID=2940571 RepID=UPI002226A671|nr:hypothetical protein [Flavobacterium sp. 7A]MCW2120276.1 hypothetical protein [Flavobacterium sp. 7A]
MVTGKEIILYNHHRQTEPLASNPTNKENYVFFEIGLIWKYIPFKTSDKRKHRIMYVILSFIRPKYILSINWISKRESLYKVWTANHPKSKFIVIQHGVYAGGFVTDMPHKYTKCDVFLTWGPYFEEHFSKFNSLKKLKIINFGNSVYNEFYRNNYSYKVNTSNKILLVPTALDKKNSDILFTLINRLKQLNFEVEVKAHAYQGRITVGKEYPKFEGVTIIKGQLYDILQKNDYDFVIADHSSSLLDTIFFKNKVLYFDPLNSIHGYTTNYSNYLSNLYDQNFENIEKNDLYSLLNIENQEALLANMITMGNNQIATI